MSARANHDNISCRCPIGGIDLTCPRLRALPWPVCAATTDGIATGLSRALVALEARAEALRRLSPTGYDWQADEAARCAKLVRGLLEALVDGPTGPGEKLAQR